MASAETEVHRLVLLFSFLGIRTDALTYIHLVRPVECPHFWIVGVACFPGFDCFCQPFLEAYTVREVTKDDQTTKFADLLDSVEAIRVTDLVDSDEVKHHGVDNKYVALDDKVG
jgi:hypothetical protein